MRVVWLGANKEGVWVLEHEGDYSKGDSLVKVSSDSSGTVSVDIQLPDE